MLKKAVFSTVAMLALMISVSISGHAQGPNVVVNGDFANATSLFNWASSLTGVGSSTGETATIANNGPLQNDKAFVYVSRPGGIASISQVVPVTGGAVYRFNFGYITNYTSGPTLQAILNDGIAPPTTYNLTLVGPANVAEIGKIFTADIASTNVTITFKIISSGFGGQICYLDNVSLTQMQ
jgi:hypothetical protein